MKKLLFLLVLAIFVAACKPDEPKPPTAAFTISNNNCQASCVISFQNTSTGDNIESYNWSFGDGTSSTTRDAVHTYDTGGNYTVTLTVTTSEGKNNATQQLVSITNATPPTPTKCKIKLISFSQFPIYAGNTLSWWDWDNSSSGSQYADCYFNLTDGLGIEYLSSNTKSNIMASDLPFLWQDAASGLFGIHPTITITDFNQSYRLRFWDYDDGVNDDIIKDFTIKPADYYPTNNQAGETQFNLNATGFGNGGIMTGIVVLEWYN